MVLLESCWNRELGDYHNEAMSYMSNTKDEMETIMSYVEEVHNDQATDTFESCYSDTKRAVAVAAGHRIFEEIDANGDGKLTLDEVNNFFDRYVVICWVVLLYFIDSS